MAYVPTYLAMAYQPVGGIAPRVFTYWNRGTLAPTAASADSDATIVGAGFFSDGVTKGMRVGDLVDAVDTGTAKYKRYQVASVSGAAATVAAPTAIT